MARVSDSTSSLSSQAVSDTAPRRTPRSSSTIGGFHRAKSFSPRGEASSATSSKGSPVRRSASCGRVADGGRGQDELRGAAVVRDQAAQAPEDHRHVRPEHAARHVRLVHHDQAETEQEVGPPLVSREDARVQHVRVGHHQVRVAPDERPLGLGRVAVVDGGAHLRQAQLAHLPELVARQRLRGEQVERGALLVEQRGLREGQVVDERLAGRGAGGEDHVVPGAPAGRGRAADAGTGRPRRAAPVAPAASAEDRRPARGLGSRAGIVRTCARDPSAPGDAESRSRNPRASTRPIVSAGCHNARTVDWVELVVALAVILFGAQLFTNGVEWIGEAFGLSEGAVGSVLAAIGTALPETLLPLIAILTGGSVSGDEIGVGAILGAPLMLSTLAMAVLGFSLLAFSRGGRRGTRLLAEASVVRQRPRVLRRHVRPGRAGRRRGLAVPRMGAGAGAAGRLRRLRGAPLPGARREASWRARRPARSAPATCWPGGTGCAGR